MYGVSSEDFWCAEPIVKYVYNCERTTITIILFLFFYAFMLLIIYVCYRNLDLGEVLDCLLGIQTLLDPSSDQMNAS